MFRSCSRSGCSDRAAALELPHIIDSSNPAIQSQFLSLVRVGGLEDVRFMLDACADTDHEKRLANAVTQSGQSALTVAIGRVYPNIVRLLLLKGADPNFVLRVKGHPEETILSLAMRTRRKFIIKECIHHYIRHNFMGKQELCSLESVDALFILPRERDIARRILVDIYAAMDVDELVEGSVADFRRRPGQTLYDVVALSAAMERKAMLINKAEPIAAGELRAASSRLQLVAAGCIHSLGDLKDELGRYEVDELLRSPHGHAALQTALKFECRTFIAQPEMQKFLEREWRGSLMHKVAGGTRGPTTQALHALTLVVSVCLNILVLPLCALCPFVETVLYNRLTLADLEVEVKIQQLRRSHCNASINSRRASLHTGETMNPNFEDSAPLNAPVPQELTACDREHHTPTGHAKGASGDTDGMDGGGGSSAVGPLGSGVETTSFTPRHAATAGPKKSQGWTSHVKRRRSSSTMASTASLLWIHSGLSRLLRQFELRPLDLYLQRTPLFKFAVRQASNLTLSLLLLLVRLEVSNDRSAMPIGRDEWLTYTLLIWAAGGLGAEMRQFASSPQMLREELLSFFNRDQPSLYRQDPFNLLDLCTCILVTVGLILPRSQADHAMIAISAASIVSCLRLMRVLTLSAHLGPLVLTFIRMLRDVLLLIIICVWVAAAFASGLFLLFKAGAKRGDATTGPLYPLSEDPHTECTRFKALMGTFELWQNSNAASLELARLPPMPADAMHERSPPAVAVFFVLSNGAISGEPLTTCLMETHPHFAAAWTYGFVFLVLTTILLINMLSAHAASNREASAAL